MEVVEMVKVVEVMIVVNTFHLYVDGGGYGIGDSSR